MSKVFRPPGSRASGTLYVLLVDATSPEGDRVVPDYNGSYAVSVGGDPAELAQKAPALGDWAIYSLPGLTTAEARDRVASAANGYDLTEMLKPYLGEVVAWEPGT